MSHLPFVVKILLEYISYTKVCLFVCVYIHYIYIIYSGVGHITKNITNVFCVCRKRRLKETGRGDWESPPL